jgi:hypothetical protein
MITFEVRLIPEFETRQRVNKLVRNGKCLVDNFQDEIKKDKNIAPELDELVATIEDVANGKIVPKNQYRKLNVSDKLKYAAYEVKSKHLRLYLIHEKDTGQIHILGGKKGDQDEDIERVERIIKEYTLFRQTFKK